MEHMPDYALMSCVLLTLKVAGLATAVSTCLGLGLAWLMTCGPASDGTSPAKSIIDALCALPLVLPPTVIGYCLILLVGRRGFLGPLLAGLDIQLIFSWKGAVVAATVVVFPLTYRASKAALESVDHNMENAPRTLARPKRFILRRVWPRMVPCGWPPRPGRGR